MIPTLRKSLCLIQALLKSIRQTVHPLSEFDVTWSYGVRSFTKLLKDSGA